MAPPLLPLLACVAGAKAPAPNLLSNGGFEVGATGWGAAFETFVLGQPLDGEWIDTASTWSIESNVEPAPPEGDSALRMTLATDSGPFAKQTPEAFLYSDYFLVPSSSGVTYSAALRAAAPVSAKLVISWHTEWQSGTVDLPVSVTTEWKRYSLSADKLPTSINNAYAAGLTFNGSGAEVWMDAARVVCGSDDSYAPAAPIELGGHAGDANMLHTPGTAVPMTTYVRNNQAQPASVVLTTTVLGPGYQRAKQYQRSVTVPAMSSAHYKDDVPPGLVGPHRVYLSAAEANKVAASHRFSFGVLAEGDPELRKLPGAKSFFGVNFDRTSNFTGSLALAQRVGLRRARSFKGDGYHQNWEPQEGKYDAGFEQAVHDLADLYASYGMAPMAVVGMNVANWAKKGGFFAPPSEDKMDAYGAFLTKFAASLGDKVSGYNTWNEPNDNAWYTGTPKQMAELLQVQYKALKKGNPDGKVVALATQHLSEPGNSPAWLTQVFGNMSQPPSQFFDTLDFHPYRLGGHAPGPEQGEAAAGPPVRDEIQMVASKFSGGKPLWTTEFGWKIESKFAPEYTIYHAQAPASWDHPGIPPHREEDQAINYVQEVAISCANTVEATFYYQFDEGPMIDRWSYGMVGANQAYPKALLFSVAAMTRNTDFSETVRQEKLLDSDVWLTTFSRAGTDTLLIYKAAGAVDVEIAVKGTDPVPAEDVYGNRFSLDVVDGKVFATITQSPLYIMRQRADVTISTAAFQLVSHAETAKRGAKTTSLSFTGSVPAALTSGVLHAGFLSADSSGTLGQGMNAVVEPDTIANEWYDAVLWLKAGTSTVGRLLSVVSISDAPAPPTPPAPPAPTPPAPPSPTPAPPTPPAPTPPTPPAPTPPTPPAPTPPTPPAPAPTPAPPGPPTPPARVYEQLTKVCENETPLPNGHSTVSSVAECESKCDATAGCNSLDTNGESCDLKGHCDGTVGACSGWCGYRLKQ